MLSTGQTNEPVDDAEQVLPARLDRPLERLTTRANRVDVLSVEQRVERTTRSEVSDEVCLCTNGICEAAEDQ